jgi:hypothetical protein
MVYRSPPICVSILQHGVQKGEIRHLLFDHGGDTVPPPVTPPERLKPEQRSVNRVCSVRLLAYTSGSIGRPANRQTRLDAGTGCDWLECV